jgi:hypothetical protein
MALQVPNYQQYYDKAYTDLNAYYQALLTQEGGDVDRVKRRLEEDYAKGNRITMEDYTSNLANTQAEYGGAVKEQAITNTAENRALQDNQLQRGISIGGLAEKQSLEQKSKQDLRREAIDRALQKSEKDLSYSKERSLEDTALTKMRGGEDVTSAFNKFQLTQKQEQGDKALGLGEQAYQRDLQKTQMEESAKQAEQSLQLQREALAKSKEPQVVEYRYTNTPA